MSARKRKSMKNKGRRKERSFPVPVTPSWAAVCIAPILAGLKSVIKKKKRGTKEADKKRGLGKEEKNVSTIYLGADLESIFCHLSQKISQAGQ